MEIISSGIVAVPSGVSATDIYVIQEGVLQVLDGGRTQDIGIAEGGQGIVSSGGYMQETTVSSGGSLFVSSGGTANSTTVNSRGSMFVSSDGTASNTTINYWGYIYVSSGGTATKTTLNGGNMSVCTDGTANETTVNKDGRMEIKRGGIAVDTTVAERGEMFISSGGTATNVTTLLKGLIWFDVASNTYVQGTSDGIPFEMKDAFISGFSTDCATLCIISGGTAVDTTLRSNGRVIISSGGIADGITVDGAFLEVSSGGTATNLSASGSYLMHFSVAPNTCIQGICDGSAFEIKDGFVSGFIVNRGYLHVLSGGVADSITVRLNGTIYVEDGGVLNNAVVTMEESGYYDGNVYVSSGGTANNTTINPMGSMWVSSGGIANDVTVKSRGRLSIERYAKLTGRMTFDGEAIVSMNSNAVLDFELTRTYLGAAALVNNLSVIQGTPVYTLTVSGTEAGGIYTLAEGAADFNSTITVQNTLGESLGTLTVGETLSVGDTDYTLNLGTETAADALTLTVEQNDTTPPVITLDADTTTILKQTTLTAKVDDGSEIYFRISEFGVWKKYTGPIIASFNETYYFKATDKAGNEGTSQITFGNIDTTGILLSTLWSQRGINPMGGNKEILYNQYTPLDPSVTPEAHCLTGCVNTAAGQLIYYFIEKGWLDLPLRLEVKDEYTSKHKATEEGGAPIVIEIKSDRSTPGTLSFAEINAMLSDYQLDSAEHAAALLYAIGVVLESKYSANSTGTSWNRVFFKRAGFEGETMGGPYFGEYYWGDMDDEMQYTITDAGFEVLIENLEAGLPVGATYPGHAFVIDGYDRESDTFHINLGWGGNQATRWYTRDEMQEELNCEYFVYDLNPEYVETFTVTDARVYGTGTMIRAFERAAGMIGDNTVAFDPSVAGKTVELLNHITFFDEVISVKDFNMNVLVTESQGGENSYGFYADHLDVFEPTDPATVLTFHASGGSLIVSTEKEFNYAFQMEDGLSCTVEVGGMLIYAGKSSDDAGAAAVLESLQVARSENTEVPEDLLDPNGWSYNGSAGEDVFSLSNSSLAVGNVSLGDGDDVLSVMGHSRLYGTIDAGDGDDSITVDSTSSVSGDLAGTCKLNFVLAERDDHAMFTIRSSASGLCADATVSVDMTNAEIGTYTLVSAASGATGVTDLRDLSITVTGSGGADFTLSMNGTSTSDFADLVYEDNSLKLQVKKKSAIIVPQTQTWEKVEGAAYYIVEYSTDNFGHVIQLAADSNALDSYQLPAGSYQVRVKADDGEWTLIGPVDAPDTGTEPGIVKSNEDGTSDVFFAKAGETWENIYCAQHVGSVNDWNGTKEIVSAKGKNRLSDLFFGSGDANILCLTDGENGDGFFVDDEYTELPEGIIEQQSRIARIDEIRAGAGSDIVDLTSNRIEYIGDGMTIRGGEGNDTIWANKGDNFLFGDAGNDRIVGASGNDVIAGGVGNDRMHGGGGTDVFTFCENFGTDTVKQLADGFVLLWFASGDESKWNAETMTYTDGENSVTVSGASEVTLKFGNDGSDQFAALSSVGAFLDFTSEKIFEESDKGILS